MDFWFDVEPARFVARPNRFLVLAELSDGRVVRAHCPDPGRLRELLLPGVRLYISRARDAKPARRTDYDLRFVERPETGQLVSLDTRLPNQLAAEGLDLGLLTPFRDHAGWRREAPGPIRGGAGVHSRFDFCIHGVDGRRCWLEVKSVTLVEDGVARFPDAPTVRGLRHVEELRRIVKETQDSAAVLFVVQRADAEVVEPHWTMDRDFSHALVRAAAAGVQLLAYTCRLTTRTAQLDRAIPVCVVAPSDAGKAASGV